MARLDYGVIFDVDGVLVDSSPAHFRSWVELARRRGMRPMTEQEFVASFGRTSREIIAELWPEEARSEEQIARLDQEKEAIYRAILEEQFPAMPGAAELLDALHAAGFRLAAGSSGPPENIRLSLDGLGRARLFDAVVTGADVERGKPDPQVFLLCAERLGLPPRRCAVVEDAAAGVAAANAAGALSIGLLSTGHQPDELAEARHMVRSLSELSPDRIQKWLDQFNGRAERRRDSP